MKIDEYAGRRVSAEDVRLVLDHARAFTSQQWAEHFCVSLRTVEDWRRNGLVLGRRLAPTQELWNQEKAEAIRWAVDVAKRLAAGDISYLLFTL